MERALELARHAPQPEPCRESDDAEVAGAREDAWEVHHAARKASKTSGLLLMRQLRADALREALPRMHALRSAARALVAINARLRSDAEALRNGAEGRGYHVALERRGDLQSQADHEPYLRALESAPIAGFADILAATQTHLLESERLLLGPAPPTTTCKEEEEAAAASNTNTKKQSKHNHHAAKMMMKPQPKEEEEKRSAAAPRRSGDDDEDADAAAADHMRLLPFEEDIDDSDEESSLDGDDEEEEAE